MQLSRLPEQYSIWLLPEAAQARQLRATVDALAQRFASEPFEPHVTIQGDVTIPLPSLASAVAAMAAAWPAQHWPVAVVEGTDAFFRSLFLRFEETPAYLDCKRRSLAASGQADGLSQFPHLSLAYGPIESNDKQRAMAELAAQWREPLCFDRVAITNATSANPICDWTVLASFALTGAATQDTQIETASA